MRPRTVVVAHRDIMVAEGIGAALTSYPSMITVGVATSSAEAEARAIAADAVAIDDTLEGAHEATARLRRRGVRVVLVGGPDPGSDEIRVSLRDPVAILASALVPETRAVRTVSCLTLRQRQILRLVAKGLAGKQVAKQLGISPKTVERHKTQIFSRLGVPNQTAAVSLAMGTGSERQDA